MSAPLKDLAGLAAAFNEKIRQVAGIVEAGAGADPLVRRVGRQVRLLLGELPFAALEIAGPYLLKYKVGINILAEGSPEGDAWFLTKDFVEDLNESKDPDRKRDTAQLLPLLKKLAQDTPFEERGPIRELVVGLLDDYVAYRRLLAKS